MDGDVRQTLGQLVSHGGTQDVVSCGWLVSVKIVTNRIERGHSLATTGDLYAVLVGEQLRETATKETSHVIQTKVVLMIP